ncbi:peptide chain release factor N(5)-glutamine methyltransferase [Rhodococcus sp. IEGM 1408]|uniref:peptide chain release factor N(5)-glutamine methyltransferase n=1 Tax=Rhodococcus sp. IEGM 1408 TaxID=3082220 RepID=UPI002952A4C4|nr:peptide chain release factor N(5)-glutamine methyltransferase [Rhodococcus sp. IEGM 1408]MDV8000557.1 peptide chain release factor N(5)-glutamine methyltransferase [Rhodococcus sp. IEGM 1408]
MTEVVRSAARALLAAGVDSAQAEARLICAHVLGVDRGALALADGVDAAGVAEVERMVAARARDRTPLQYLVGRATSGRLDLAVGPGVFIPRPETELLVESTLAALPAPGPGTGPGPVVVDLCAGSGTLALEIAHARPDASVHAVELHGPALEWLRRNVAERAAAGDTPVEVHQADATDPGLLAHLRGRVDAVVSNPPYIPQTDDLPADVLGHEPPTALFGGTDGLVVIAPLVDVAAGLLAPGGHLALEHDDTTGAAVAAVVSARGRFGTVDQHTDLAGRPRFVTATRLDSDHDDDNSGPDDEVDPTVQKGITR